MAAKEAHGGTGHGGHGRGSGEPGRGEAMCCGGPGAAWPKAIEKGRHDEKRSV